MRTVAGFPWRKLSALASVEHAVTDDGWIVFRGEAAPFSVSRAFVWVSSGPEAWALRTSGAPLTATNVRRAFGDPIGRFSDLLGVDDRILVSTIGCESGPYVSYPPSVFQLRAPRTEPGYPDRVGDSDRGDEARDVVDWNRTHGMKSSHGVMQTLIGTAVGVATHLFARVPVAKYREVLWSPEASIECGARYLASFGASVLADPLATRAKYGAGGIYPSGSNRFGVRLYSEAVITMFAAYWNDAMAIERGIA